jgi:hypothetical protein
MYAWYLWCPAHQNSYQKIDQKICAPHCQWYRKLSVIESAKDCSYLWHFQMKNCSNLVINFIPLSLLLFFADFNYHMNADNCYFVNRITTGLHFKMKNCFSLVTNFIPLSTVLYLHPVCEIFLEGKNPATGGNRLKYLCLSAHLPCWKCAVTVF